MFWRCGVVFLSLLLLSCTNNKTADLKKITVLSVNGQVFSASDFGSALAKKLKIYDALAAKDSTNIKREREAVMQEFIVSALLSQYAKEHGIEVGEDDLLSEVDRIKKTYPDDLTFRAALATEGQSLDDWKVGLANTLLQRKVFAALSEKTPQTLKAQEEAAKLLYDTRKDDYMRPAQIHLQQIVVTREDDAERIFHKIKSGVSFASLAQKFSISPDGSQGGDIGYVAKGTMPAFDSAFSLSVGQLSGIVKSSYGFHIMKVLDKRAAGHLTFEQVKPRLMREVAAKKQQEVFNHWLEAALKSATIKRNDALLDKIKVRTEGEEE